MRKSLENILIDSAEHKISRAEIKWKTAHPELVSELQKLADMYVSMGRYACAEPICWKILEIQHRLNGALHPDVAKTLLTMGKLHEAQDSLEFAEQFYVAALWILDQNGDGSSELFGRVLMSLLAIYKNRLNYERVAYVEERLCTYLNIEPEIANLIVPDVHAFRMFADFAA
jgi:tetratricopeptide (TPR) repeat protein